MCYQSQLALQLRSGESGEAIALAVQRQDREDDMRTSMLNAGAFASLVIAMASPAFGQEATEEDEGAIRDIVVTAQRREENIQDVPVAVTALDSIALSQSAVEDIRDLAGRVPSLVVDNVNAGPSAAAISIRGISFEDIEKSFDPAVGVVVDGVFIGTNTGQLLDAFDLESVEVLRGPQGTLFGRNTIGGVINLRRSRPTGEFGVKASVGYAEFNSIRGRLTVNTPEIGNVLALKGFVAWDKTDGYLRNVTLNRRAGKDNTLSLGLTAQVKPSDNITALLTYEHFRQRSETQTASVSETGKDTICLAIPGPGGILIRPFAPANQCDRISRGDSLYQVFGNIETPVTYDADRLSGEITVGLGDFELVSITGYQKSDESVRQDFDSTSFNFFDTLRNQDYEQFSQEIRLAGDISDQINVLLGAYYFDSSYFLVQTTNLGFIPRTITQRSGVDSKSYAGFADVKFKLSDRLTIGGGGRYTRDKKSFVSNYALNTTGACPVGVFGITAADCVGRESFGKFTYRASADFKLGDNQLIYASYSTGFRSGSFNGRAATPAARGPYRPELVKAFEVGLKADWLDRRLRTNLALFTTDYTNKQEEIVEATPPPFNAINPQQTVVRNAASARINGLELEVVAKPSNSFTFFGSLSYLDAKYKQFFRDVTGDLVLDDVSTLDLRRAPKFSWSVGVDYTKEVGAGTFSLSPVFRFTDDYTTCLIENRPVTLGAVTNDRRCNTGTREILDVTMSYSLPIGGADAKISLFARNLLDDRGISGTLPVAGLFTFSGVRPPRQFGGELQIKF
jgi:iron complex outermembrane recepter protein